MAELLFWRTRGSNKPNLGIRGSKDGQRVLISVAPDVKYFKTDSNTESLRPIMPDDLKYFEKKPVVDSPHGQGKSKHNVQRQRLRAEVNKLYEELRTLKSNQNPDYLVIPTPTWEAFAWEPMPEHDYNPDAWAAGFSYLHNNFSKEKAKPVEPDFNTTLRARVKNSSTKYIWKKTNYLGGIWWVTNADHVLTFAQYNDLIDPEIVGTDSE